MQPHARLHPPGAERPADDLQSRRRAAPGYREGHLAMLHPPGEALGAQADELSALLIDEVGELAQRFGHLSPQRRGGALGEQVALARLQAAHRLALGGEREQQWHHLSGARRRFAIERDVIDAVLVIERPERRQKLRRFATGQLRHLPSSLSPFALLGATRARARKPESTGRYSGTAEGTEGNTQMQLKQWVGRSDFRCCFLLVGRVPLAAGLNRRRISCPHGHRRDPPHDRAARRPR